MIKKAQQYMSPEDRKKYLELYRQKLEYNRKSNGKNK